MIRVLVTTGGTAVSVFIQCNGLHGTRAEWTIHAAAVAHSDVHVLRT